MKLACLQDAKETAEQTKPADAKLMAKQTDKVVKKVEKGTPQSEEVAAIQAVDAAKQVKKDIFHTAQPAKIAKDEKKAVAAAKKVPKALASAAVAVGEVKAEEAAEKVEETPSKKNEQALVAKAKDLTKIKTAKKLNAPEVKAVEVTRAIDAKKEEVLRRKQQVVTDEEKKLVKGAQSLVVQKVLDAEKNAEKAEPKEIKPDTKTTAEIRKEIEPKKSVKQEAKKVGLRKAVAAMARSGGKVGNALAQILEASGKDPKMNAQGNMMTQAEQTDAAKEMKADVKRMFPKGRAKPNPEGEQEAKDPNAKDMAKMTKSIEDESVPAGGFQDAVNKKSKEEKKKEEKKLEKDEATSQVEKVGLGIQLEKGGKKAEEKAEVEQAEEKSEEKAEEKVAEEEVAESP